MRPAAVLEGDQPTALQVAVDGDLRAIVTSSYTLGRRFFGAK
jgi:hypothetical protein